MEAANALRLGFFYLVLIGLTVIVQSIANRLMKSFSYFVETKNFPAKGTIFMLVLIYIVIFAILIDILIWTAFIMISGVLPYFWDAFTFATDCFTTLGTIGSLEPPWEYLGPVIAVNGIVIIAFAGSCLYSILYKA